MTKRKPRRPTDKQIERFLKQHFERMRRDCEKWFGKPRRRKSK